MDKNNYRIYFVDGTTALINELEYTGVVEAANAKVLGDYIIFHSHLFVRSANITHIELEKSLDQSSSYIPPKEPNEIKEQKEKDRVERISDLGSVIESHKEAQPDEKA